MFPGGQRASCLLLWPRTPPLPIPSSLCRQLQPWRWPFLTCEAGIDLVVAGPEPEDGVVPAAHPLHGGGSHLLEVVGAVSAAEEVVHVAADGLQDLLGLGCGAEGTPCTEALRPACPCQPTTGPSRSPLRGTPTPAHPMRGPGAPGRLLHLPRVTSELTLSPPKPVSYLCHSSGPSSLTKVQQDTRAP